MIIRESPSPRKPQGDTNWPPKSARDALISSPSRRKRLLEVTGADEATSPSKRRRRAPILPEENESADDDEDEETIRLRLEAIEARLKLKKLQNAKSKDTGSVKDEKALANESSISPRRSSERPILNEAKTSCNVQVPHSPKPQKAMPPPESPRRVQLGIDKGLRATNVSLKKSKSMIDSTRPTAEVASDMPLTKPRSFNERLAEARTQDLAKQQKHERMQNSRSTGFNLNVPAKPESTSVMNVRKDQHRTTTTSSTSHRHFKPGFEQSGSTKEAELAEREEESDEKNNQISAEPSVLSNDAGMVQPSQSTEDFDRFSGFQLSKRHIKESSLEAALDGKELISIPKLLKMVTSPNYEPPDVENDYVVFGIIASKSLPRNHAPKDQNHSDADPASAPQKSKFMVLRLVDLKWEIDMFLFNTAFDKFWKLSSGTVIAILNPGIMPPKPHLRDTGAFSLKLASSEETVLEIGKAKDLGFCKSIKKDGQQCTQWIDGRKTEFCDFHINLRVEKAKTERMEINCMAGIGLFGNTVKNSRRQDVSFSSVGRRGGGVHQEIRKRVPRHGGRYDVTTGEMTYSIPKEFRGALNTAGLLDAEDYVHGGISKQERSRRRIAEKEKERDLAKALGAQGNGMGGEYMRMKEQESSIRAGEGQSTKQEDHPDATALGLVGSNAAAVKLSPVKDGKHRLRTSKAEPMGWGGAFRRGLPSPTRNKTPNVDAQKKSFKMVADNKQDAAHVSPQKKARFMIDNKGVRVPGRESLAEHEKPEVADNYEDDDLDIV